MPGATRKAADRAALRCVRDAVTPAVDTGVWSCLDDTTKGVLTDLAVKHGVEGWVYQRAKAVGLELPAIASAVHAALARYQRALSDLEVVDDTLTAIECPFLVVKGPALVAQFYSVPELRSSVDLDVLVRPGDVAEALQALECAGCTVLDANWPLLTRLRVHELRVQTPSGGLIDLHWSLGSLRAPADTAPPAATLIDRGHQIVIGSSRVHTLGWADTVVHLTVHAAGSGGDRLIWYADLRGALAVAPPGGEQAAVECAVQWGAVPALQLMLLRSRRAIGLQPPPALIDGLSRNGPRFAWPALVRAVDRLAPVGPDPGRPSVRRMTARSTRRGGVDSLRALVTKGMQALHPGRRSDRNRLRGFDDPRSGLFASGGSAEREHFLTQLTTQSR